MGKKENIAWLHAQLNWATAKILKQESAESKLWWLTRPKTEGDIKREQEVQKFDLSLIDGINNKIHIAQFSIYIQQAIAIVDNSDLTNKEKQENLVLLYRKEQLAKKYPEDSLYLDGSASRAKYNPKSYSHYGLEYLKLIVENIQARLKKQEESNDDIEIIDIKVQLDEYHDLVKNPFTAKYRRGSKYKSDLDFTAVKNGEINYAAQKERFDKVMGFCFRETEKDANDESESNLKEIQYTYRNFADEVDNKVVINRSEVKIKFETLGMELDLLERSLQKNRQMQLKLPGEIKHLKSNLTDISYLIEHSKNFGHFSWNIHIQNTMHRLGFLDEYNRLWGDPVGPIVLDTDNVAKVRQSLQKQPSSVELKNFIERLSIIQSIVEREYQTKIKDLNKLDKKIKFDARLRDMETDLLAMYKCATESGEMWSSEKNDRLRLMEKAINKFKINPHASQFVNGGDVVWGTSLYRDPRVSIVKEVDMKDSPTMVSRSSFSLYPEDHTTDIDDKLSMDSGESSESSMKSGLLAVNFSTRGMLLESLNQYLQPYERLIKSESFLDKIYLMIWAPCEKELKAAHALKKIVSERDALTLSQIKSGLYYNLNIALFNNNPGLRESFLDYLFGFEFASNKDVKELLAVANVTLKSVPRPSWWQFWKEDEYLNRYLSLHDRIMKLEDKINPQSPSYVGYGPDKSLASTGPLHLVDTNLRSSTTQPILISPGLSTCAGTKVPNDSETTGVATKAYR